MAETELFQNAKYVAQATVNSAENGKKVRRCMKPTFYFLAESPLRNIPPLAIVLHAAVFEICRDKNRGEGTLKEWAQLHRRDRMRELREGLKGDAGGVKKGQRNSKMKKEKVERKQTRLIKLFWTTDPIKAAVSTAERLTDLLLLKLNTLWAVLSASATCARCINTYNAVHCLHAV